MIALTLLLQLTPMVPVKPLRPVPGIDMAGGDVDALVQIVMMQAASDASQDLRDTMADLKRLTEQKRAMRESMQRMKGEMDRLKGQLRADYASPTGRIAPGTTFRDYQKWSGVSVQQSWAASLATACPKGLARDACLIERTRLRADQLAKMPSPK